MAKKTEQNSRERRTAERAANRVPSVQQGTKSQAFIDVQELRASIIPVVEEFGCVLESLTAHGAGSNKTLEIVVDYTEERTDFLSLDTIAEISQAISATLDQADDGDSPYLLEVSSPGATRPLIEPRHWKRSVGRLLSVVTTESGEPFLARLDEVQDDGVVVRRKKQTKKGQPESYKDAETLPFDSISAANVEIEFNH